MGDTKWKRFAGRPGKRTGIFYLVLVACALCPAAAARADGFNGNFQFDYSHLDSESRDASGTVSKTASDSILQRYRLALNKTLFPTLTTNASIFFEKSDATAETDGVKTDTSGNRIQPSIDVSLNLRPVTAGAGYRRDEERQKSSGVSSPTLVREFSTGRFGWKPTGFPTLDLLYTRTSNFDKDRVLQDTVDDMVNVSSRYSPVKQLDLLYQGSVDDLTDRRTNNEVRSTTHGGRINFSDGYWKNRASLNTSYSITTRQTEVLTSGHGDISTLLSPFFGLTALTDMPTQVVLQQNTALIDGNLTGGIGIDLGLPPPGGDARRRNIGLDFFNDTEVNTLFVWVDRELPAGIAGSFSWDIYTSPDNRNWTLWQTVAPAPFGPFLNRFEIDFPNVVCRYLKVVTRPLSSTVIGASGFPNIQVTELQAAIRKPASALSRKDSQTSHLLNTNVRARLLDVPSLYYDFSYLLAKSQSSPSRSFFSNSLALNHQFSPMFSGTARGAREDSLDVRGNRVGYAYSASLAAYPLPTLSHTLTFGGRTEKFHDQKSDSNSVYLNNSAELYKGINVNLAGGINRATAENGEKSHGTTVVAGVNLVPHRTLNVNLALNDSTSRKTGAGKPDSSDSTRTEEVSASFNPVRTLYLFGSVSILHQKDRPQSTVKNFSLNWSPFQDGTLHFNIGYAESVRSEDQGRDRTITPGIRWNITRSASLDVSYQNIRSDTVSQQSRTNVFSTDLRVVF